MRRARIYQAAGAVLSLSLVLAGPGGAAAHHDLRELARYHAVNRPGEPMYIPASPGPHGAKSIEELTRESQVVLRGRLSRPMSYLASNGTHIATDYRILDPTILAGQLSGALSARPGGGPPLILTVWGGEVVLEGVTVVATDGNREAIDDGGEYLLFLRPWGPPEKGSYRIYHVGIFAISHKTVRPLFRQADVLLKGTTDGTLNGLMSQIRAATAGR